jgi:hypothetical protein
MRNPLNEAKICFDLSQILPKDKKWFEIMSWRYLLIWAENEKP